MAQRPSIFDPATGTDLEHLNAISVGRFPEHIGIRIIEARRGYLRGELEVDGHLMAPNGFLHAATVVGLADTCCGYGVRGAAPEGATGFTTVELKSNFLGTVKEGTISCEAQLVHGGRTTQVWDATVRQGDTVLCLFRCTQLILYPR